MKVEELERELRAARPEPSVDFARRLDEWAEAGFPPDRGLGPRAGAAGRSLPAVDGLRRLWHRLSATPPRRILLPAGAVATVVVVAGVAISQNGSDTGGFTSRTTPETEATSPLQPAGADSAAGAADATAEEGGGTAGPTSPLAEQATAEDLDVGEPGADGIARGTDERIVDASARITLGADSDAVQDVANGVVEVTDRHGGVVLDSQVTSDQAGARASFELEVPFKELDAALADLSALADVISRTAATEDITAQAVRARKDLADLLERIREARIELIRADTREEKLVIRSEIASLQASADALETELAGVKRQGRFATVGVEVTSNGSASDEGGWSLGDALSDAGRVLEVIGGIALIALAILAPVTLLVAVAALAIRWVRRRGREQALDA